MSARPWVVTCDPGVDDAVALAVAAGRDDCDVRAVVAGAGNVDADTAWRNATGLADLLGLDVPVAIGSAATVDGRPIRRDGHVHGADGLAGLAHRLATPVGTPADGRPLVRGDVMATGPLTDVALALRAGRPVARVVWMGGSFAPAAGGRSSPGPEFNAGVDPRAVDEVLAAEIDVAVVPIEITRQVAIAPEDLARWSSGPPPARLCADLAAHRVHAGPGGASPPTGADAPRPHREPPGPDRPPHAGHRVGLHDPVAVVAALEPRLFRWERWRLRCSRGDEHARGALVPVAGPPEAAVAVAVDAAAVRRRIVDAVLASGRP